jgi:amidase
MDISARPGPGTYRRRASAFYVLKDFRIGYVLDSPMASPTSEGRTVLEHAIASLERVGAQLRPGWPTGYDLSAAFNNYMFLLSAFTFSTESKEDQEKDRKHYQQGPTNLFAAGALASYADWQKQHFRQLAFRAMWQDYFEQIDVFLMPCSFTVAIHHNHADFNSRMLDTGDGKRPYIQLMPWMVTATLTGCPATVAPIGQTSTAVPVGMQIIGPFWEDATPIEFAALLSREIGGFKAPAGYGS